MTVPGLGTATTDKLGSTPVNFQALIKAHKEFGGSQTMLLQAGIASPPLKDPQGNLYFFRVTAADPSHSPVSVDEVRDQVVRDLKRKAEYDRIKTSVASIEAEARKDGLLQVAIDNGTVVQSTQAVYLWSEYWVQAMVQYRMPMTPQPASLPVIGQDRKVTEAIIDRSLTLPQDKPAEDLPPDQRIFVVPADDKLALVVVELHSQRPLPRESFDHLAEIGGIQELITAEETDQKRSVEQAFAYDTLAKRNHFAMTRETEQSKDESTKTEPAKTASAG
jgi:hypothetical protein